MDLLSCSSSPHLQYQFYWFVLSIHVLINSIHFLCYWLWGLVDLYPIKHYHQVSKYREKNFIGHEIWFFDLYSLFPAHTDCWTRGMSALVSPSLSHLFGIIKCHNSPQIWTSKITASYCIKPKNGKKKKSLLKLLNYYLPKRLV